MRLTLAKLSLSLMTFVFQVTAGAQLIELEPKSYINPFRALGSLEADHRSDELLFLIKSILSDCDQRQESVGSFASAELKKLFESYCSFPALYKSYFDRVDILRKDNNLIRLPDVMSLDELTLDPLYNKLLAGNWNKRRLVRDQKQKPDKFIADLLLTNIALRKTLEDISKLYRDHWSPHVHSGFLYVHPKLRATLSGRNNLLTLYEYYQHIKCSLRSGDSPRDYFCEGYKNLMAGWLNHELKSVKTITQELQESLSKVGLATADGRVVDRFNNIKAAASKYFNLGRDEVAVEDLRNYLIRPNQALNATKPDITQTQVEVAVRGEIKDFVDSMSVLVKRSTSLVNEEALQAYEAVSVFSQIQEVVRLSDQHMFFEGIVGKGLSESKVLESKEYKEFHKQLVVEVQNLSSRIFIFLDYSLGGL